jgi:large subunit ribosomal protein L10
MRPEKEAIVREVKTYLEDSSYLLVADYSGLTVMDLAELRDSLRENESELHIVKNTFLRKAMEVVGWDDIATMLSGPTAMVTGSGEVTAVAKALEAFVKGHKSTAIKGGCLDGKTLSAADVDALAKVPPREVMLGMLVGTIAAPMTQLVGVFNQKLLSLLYVLKAVEDNKSGE